MSEESYRAFALSTDAIHDVLKYPCKDSRANSAQFKCDKKCCDSLGTISQAVYAITTLRRKLWVDPNQLSNINLKCMKGNDIRNAKLIEILFLIMLTVFLLIKYIANLYLVIVRSKFASIFSD